MISSRKFPMEEKKPIRALAIDDDELHLDLASLAIEEIGGVTVELATEARPHVNDIILGKRSYDIVLLDILMPGMNGIEACRHIKSALGTRAPNMVMMTAMDDQSHIDAAFLAGADDYIIKPFTAADISSRLGLVQRRAALMPAPRNKVRDIGETVLDKNRETIPHLVSMQAMTAYVSTLDRGRAALSMVTSFVLSGSEPPTEPLVDHCVKLIYEKLRNTPHVLSYFGEGIFVCVTRRADPAISKRLVADINAVLASQFGRCVEMYRGEPDAASPSAAALLEAALVAARTGRTASAVVARPVASLPDLFAR
jgi:CheY-like chemotaxis protein